MFISVFFDLVYDQDVIEKKNIRPSAIASGVRGPLLGLDVQHTVSGRPRLWRILQPITVDHRWEKAYLLIKEILTVHLVIL